MNRARRALQLQTFHAALAAGHLGKWSDLPGQRRWRRSSSRLQFIFGLADLGAHFLEFELDDIVLCFLVVAIREKWLDFYI